MGHPGLGAVTWPLVGGALGTLSWQAPFAVYLIALPLGRVGALRCRCRLSAAVYDRLVFPSSFAWIEALAPTDRQGQFILVAIPVDRSLDTDETGTVVALELSNVLSTGI